MLLRILLCMGLCLGLNALRAELKWTPEQGWTSSSGLMSLFVDDGEGGHTGVKLMNKAKKLQDEKILEKAPFHDLAPEALMNIALVAQERGKAEQVIDALERLIYGYSKSELCEKAYILLGDTYAGLVQGPAYDQAPTRKAYHVYEDFLEAYPNSTLVAKAEAGAKKALEMLAASRLELGDFYYKYRNNPKAAVVLYNDAVSIAPNSDVASHAKASIQLVKNKVQPPKTWVDVVFGRYERRDYEDDVF